METKQFRGDLLTMIIVIVWMDLMSPELLPVKMEGITFHCLLLHAFLLFFEIEFQI